ncbi:TetR/AcrR family transcriptional regulator [Asticcacaulis sp. ZE23SCel15]|uniref:TetR/AcrR family transcriptional regulator n=1 Tax=Asticcacaulis sp. ZE23SCel15 TaxID=3059027 RepID=UPI002660525A|nr:TetR/AcrR family transcriptional regulator [Asticcacaulis sp. ZE23SCel15]WKL56322.1 TetR/AcrR family transcriptional regulator [Asticcacaulis sp. ZE23SCel15]
MNTSVSPKPATKPRQNREARQQHILDATARCVRQSGFHGASMASIAQEAGMSVGVIYRYFANKEAIIEAIVANDLAELREKFAEFDDIADADLIDRLVDIIPMAIEHKYNSEKTALALEVLAEAARNPNVAAIVKKSEAQERELVLTLLRRIYGEDIETSTLLARNEVIAMIFDGMLVRSVCAPDVDRDQMIKWLRKVVRYAFEMKDD